MAAVLAGTGAMMVLLQRFYVRAGRELRRLDSTSRSPWVHPVVFADLQDIHLVLRDVGSHMARSRDSAGSLLMRLVSIRMDCGQSELWEPRLYVKSS